MHFEFDRGDKVHVIELVELGGGRWRAHWSLRSAKTDAGELLAEGSFEFEAQPSGAASYSVLHGLEVHEMRLESHGSKRSVIESGRATDFEHRDRFGSGAEAAARHAGGPAEIASPMPGRVVELLVEQGARVEEGQTLVVVEAMKMANEYRAPIAGTVSALRCRVGDAVEGGSILLVVEPHAAE